MWKLGMFWFFKKHLFCRTPFHGCFLKLYYSAVKQWQAIPLLHQQGETCNIAKGGSRTFWFDKGRLEGSCILSWGSSVVLGPFLVGDVPLSACHANKGTPWLWNTFGIASITSDTKDAVKVNCDIPVTSATKLK